MCVALRRAAEAPSVADAAGFITRKRRLSLEKPVPTAVCFAGRAVHSDRPGACGCRCGGPDLGDVRSPLNYTTDRFIEIYNSGSDAVDLAGWSLVAVGNGGTIFTWQDALRLDRPGEALVAGDATTVTGFPVDFPDDAWSSSNGLWNGKVGDGAKLLDSAGVLIDYAVVAGTAFENADYVRKLRHRLAEHHLHPVGMDIDAGESGDGCVSGDPQHGAPDPGADDNLLARRSGFASHGRTRRSTSSPTSPTR